jgi:hypothetical protein
MRQSEGSRHETVFRDETMGTLHAVNGKGYLRMLRRATNLGDFHRVIFMRRTPLV